VRITRTPTPASADGIKSEPVIVDASKVLAGEEEADPELCPLLEDGDVVYVPRRREPCLSWARCKGRECTPWIPQGSGQGYSILSQLRGGPGINADTSCIQVTRHREQGTEIIKVDLDALEAARSLKPPVHGVNMMAHSSLCPVMWFMCRKLS